jgi:hypothetical protein
VTITAPVSTEAAAWYGLSVEEVIEPGLMRLPPNRTLNLTALAEVVLAVAVTQVDGFNRLLGTRPLTAGQFGLAVASALVIFVLWEGGKLVARRRAP